MNIADLFKKKVKKPKEALVLRRKAHSTGTHVCLYRSAMSEIEMDPALPWTTLCEEHGGSVSHETRKNAESFLSHPEEWCPTCQEPKDE